MFCCCCGPACLNFCPIYIPLFKAISHASHIINRVFHIELNLSAYSNVIKTSSLIISIISCTKHCTTHSTHSHFEAFWCMLNWCIQRFWNQIQIKIIKSNFLTWKKLMYGKVHFRKLCKRQISNIRGDSYSNSCLFCQI